MYQDNHLKFVDISFFYIISKGDNTDWTAEEIKCSYEKEDQSVSLKIYQSADVTKVKQISLYKNARTVHGIGSAHELVVTRRKTELKEKSGGKVSKTFYPDLARGKSTKTTQPSTKIEMKVELKHNKDDHDNTLQPIHYDSVDSVETPVTMPQDSESAGNSGTSDTPILMISKKTFNVVPVKMVSPFTIAPMSSGLESSEENSCQPEFDLFVWVVICCESAKTGKDIHYIAQVLKVLYDSNILEYVYEVRCYSLVRDPTTN